MLKLKQKKQQKRAKKLTGKLAMTESWCCVTPPSYVSAMRVWVNEVLVKEELKREGTSNKT